MLRLKGLKLAQDRSKQAIEKESIHIHRNTTRLSNFYTMTFPVDLFTTK